LIKADDTPPELKKVYDARQNSLKWILVTSFGYLGYSNSKFGRIDAHIATCAFDRQIFMQAARIAERLGFTVLHGIVDSIWVKKHSSTEADYSALKAAIEKETGFEISFEGVYKWVAFVHSKGKEQVPVPNRYFGVFSDGKMKIRGIGQRRHDTPKFFSRCEAEVLKIMACGNTATEVLERMPAVRETFQRQVRALKEKKVPLADLVFTKRLSKESDEYRVNTAETSALRQLVEEGGHLHAGEILQYVITDYYKNGVKRAVPIQLIDEKTDYDARRYAELLTEMINSIIEPFGVSNVVELQNSGRLLLL
jgi:DNA polymerase, archaea type